MIRAALVRAYGYGLDALLPLAPERWRLPALRALLRATGGSPGVRWAVVLPLAAVGAAHRGTQRWRACRAARREMRSGRW